MPAPRVLSGKRLRDAGVSAVGFTGGCQCAAVRYTIAAESLVAYACHCRECQKQSASAFGVSVPVLESALSIEGETASWGRPTDSGSWTDCHFCPRCGTRLFHDARGRPGVLTIKGGSLDEPGQLEFVAHIWTSRKQPWIDLPERLVQWGTQPSTQAEWLQMLSGAP
ncbi:MAG: GFA family protein [Erythrobacter sp.]|jgi:hypothetical protein|nr:GFA family protein [Erythrobacter sp.]